MNNNFLKFDFCNPIKRPITRIFLIPLNDTINFTKLEIFYRHSACVNRVTPHLQFVYRIYI